ncbi:type II toxin-antitoxin system VapC family toxin [Niveispirillum sp. KHB5.9]|uniref:type II toxin-antitoxin system VapC family toxin n=1 Tax=Niveispirillum sp. KHB5.9 TaxID=3400269 RepID=UPI003A877386
MDTNVLVRALVEDDPAQAEAAQALLTHANLIAVPVTVLCEVSWVLRSNYRLSASAIAEAIESILSVDTVVTDAGAAQAGLAFLKAGGDFGDGVIAHQGKGMGGSIFVSFDAKARTLWRATGGEVLAPVTDI